MASNVLIFPAANSPAANSHRAPQHAEPARFSRSRHIHLCDHTSGDSTPGRRTSGDPIDNKPSSRPLDLAAQVGLTVSFVNRRLAEQHASERRRRYFHPDTDDFPDIPA